MRAAAQVMTAIAPSMRNIDKATCHAGGLTAVMRRNMSRGAKKGTSDSTTAAVLSGAARTIG